MINRNGVSLPAHLRDFAVDWRNTTIAELALNRAEDTPEIEALNDGEGHDYGSLVEQAIALVASLWELGLRPGDVISFQLPNWHEAAVVNLAGAYLGLVVNPIVPIYRQAEVRETLLASGSRALFVPSTFRGFSHGDMALSLQRDVPTLTHVIQVRGDTSLGLQWSELISSGRGRRPPMARVDPNAVKLLLYTSGTTGRPKGVLHSHNTALRVLDVLVRHWQVQAGDTILMPSPVSHISGYSNGLELPFVAGTRTLLMERWNAQEAVRLICNERVAGTVAATPFLQELNQAASEAGTDLPSLRYFACGGAAVPESLVRSANSRFRQTCVFRVYGSSEVPLVTLGYLGRECADLAASTDGQIVDYAVRVVDSEGRDCKADEEGELLVRGPAMFCGYQDAEQTEAAIDTRGYFRTGDLGIVSADGAVRITGRKKDLIIRGGENISAGEIEEVLLQHPGVADVAVVSMPHARLGEGVCAYVVPTPGEPEPSLSVLSEFVFKHGLARQKCPERLEFVDTLPRTASGKVKKDQLRAAIRDRLEEESRC